MLIADELTTDEQLEEAFRLEGARHSEHPITWGRPHVVQLVTTELQP